MTPEPGRTGPLRVSNEFAFVDVEVLRTYGGTVLHVRDLQTGAAIALDALELEALTRLRHADFGRLVDPSFEGFEPAAGNGDGSWPSAGEGDAAPAAGTADPSEEPS